MNVLKVLCKKIMKKKKIATLIFKKRKVEDLVTTTYKHCRPNVLRKIVKQMLLVLKTRTERLLVMANLALPNVNGS